MKAVYFQTIAGIALTFGLSACVSGVVSSASQTIPAEDVIAPQPASQPAPRAAPPPPFGPPLPVINEPVYNSYLDAPQTPGTWFYISEPSETLAIFATDLSDDAKLIVRCAQGRVALARITTNDSTLPRSIAVTTETTKRDLLASPVRGRDRMVGVELAANDPLLDAMAITKGRIAIAVKGERTLYLPAWVEISRVIEDCR